MKWCFDTSALIEPWGRLYPPDMFGPLWEKLSELADQGVIAAPVDARLELERQSDDLLKWVKGLSSFFIEVDRAVAERVADIVNAHPGLIKLNTTKSGADPFVIAMAEVRGVPVVTYEQPARLNASPRIPNVCSARGVQVVSLVEVLRAEGFRLP